MSWYECEISSTREGYLYVDGGQKLNFFLTSNDKKRLVFEFKRLVLNSN
jgi:hypothetical protein